MRGRKRGVRIDTYRKCNDGNGYILCYAPNHKYAKKDGNVFEHRLVMEKHIGRFLRPDEVVHHINGIKNDNRIENLRLMDKKEHNLMENPSGEKNRFWILNAIHRRSRRERYLIYDIDRCPRCNRFKDKRAKICLSCRTGGKKCGIAQKVLN